MIENLKKHAGVLVNTGARVVVVFRKLPADPTQCLIAETGRLPDMYHDFIMQCLNSREAAETNDFYEILNRRSFPDGLNCLTALHQRGFLRKEPVDNVNLIPLPGQIVPLKLINATIDKTVDEYVAAEAAEKHTQAAAADPAATARMLIMQAELLEKDAAAKREEAYALDPSSKPTVGRPRTADEERAAKMEDRKEKRRVRERKLTVTNRIERVESALDARVAEKIERDALRAASAEQ